MPINPPAARRGAFVAAIFLSVALLFNDLAEAKFDPISMASRAVKKTVQKIKDGRRKSKKKHVIFSTDSAGGVYGPNGAFDECPAVVARDELLATDNVSNYGSNVNENVNDNVNDRIVTEGLLRDGDIADRDIDDTMALVLAINHEHEVDIDLIVPMFGNCNMPSAFMFAKQVVHVIKNRPGIPIVPGASEAIQPPFIDAYRFGEFLDEEGYGGARRTGLPRAPFQKPDRPSDGGPTIDAVHVFRMSCANHGVVAMKEKLRTALKKNYKIDVLGIGPMTDLACLLLHIDDGNGNRNNNDAKLVNAIEKFVLLIGQPAGKGFRLADFNTWTDPLATAVVMSFSHKVPIVLMNLELTSQTTGDPKTNPRSLPFGPGSLKNGTLPFFRQAKKKANPNEGPFDQYTLAYALHPEWFVCDAYPAYVIQCEVRSRRRPPGDYDPKAACTAPVTATAAYHKSIAAELTIDLDRAYAGELVVGDPDGNILSYRDAPAANVTACTDFADFDAFEEFVYQLY